MKKNLFLIACVAPLLGFAQATAFIGSNAKVTNKANTLITVVGDMKVADAATTDGVNVNNHGNINVTGGFANTDANGKNFVNRFTDATNYGQLILNNDAGDSNINAKISGEFKLVSGFAYHSFAVPYQTTVGELLSDAGVTNPTFYTFTAGSNGYDNNRGKNPLLRWDNATAIFEHYTGEGEVVRPFDFVAFSNVAGYTPDQNRPEINTVRTYTGEVVLDKTAAANGANAYATLWNTTVSNTDANQYGELWGTYLSDPFDNGGSATEATWSQIGTTIDNSNGYGKNVAFLGNPYTSNIDLRKANMTGARGVYQYVGNDYVREDGNSTAVTSATDFVLSTFTDNTNVLGDATAMVVRPYHTFGVKSTKSNNSDWTFPNEVKTFSTGGVSPLSFSKGSQVNDFYQVGIDLYDGEGVNTNARFYVVASNNFESGKTSILEAYNVFLEDNAIGAYTLQENVDGSINEDLKTNKTYINGINAADYVAKPVHVVFQGSTGGEYTFKARLSEALLNSGNKFYFEDKVGGVIKEITPDFVYNFSQAGTVADRFVIYYNGLPSDLNVAEVAVVAETVVYQDINKTHNIRFAKGLNTADIFVYALSGQLVFTDKNVKTDVDYVLPKQAQAGAFVVKIVGDNGSVTTKKIVQ